MNKESNLETIIRVIKKYNQSKYYSTVDDVINIDGTNFKLAVYELLDMLDEKNWELKREKELLQEKIYIYEEIIRKSNFVPLLKGDIND